jgi:hypothetical protein
MLVGQTAVLFCEQASRALQIQGRTPTFLPRPKRFSAMYALKRVANRAIAPPIASCAPPILRDIPALANREESVSVSIEFGGDELGT